MSRRKLSQAVTGTLVVLLAVTVLVGCGGQNGGPLDEAGGKQAETAKSGGQRGGVFRVGDLRFRVPDSWIMEEPQSTSFVRRLGQFRLPGPDGDAELTVIQAGGTVEQNLVRWYGQFGLERGKAEGAEEREIEVAGYRAVFVDIRGTYSPGPMMLRPGQKARNPNYRMLAAIVETPGQLTFFKAVGPERTLERHKEAFLEFLTGAVRGE